LCVPKAPAIGEDGRPKYYVRLNQAIMDPITNRKRTQFTFQEKNLKVVEDKNDTNKEKNTDKENEATDLATSFIQSDEIAKESEAIMMKKSQEMAKSVMHFKQMPMAPMAEEVVAKR